MRRDWIWLLGLLAALGIGYGLGRADKRDAPIRAEFDRRSGAGSADRSGDPRREAGRSPEPAPAEAAVTGGHLAWEQAIGRPPTDAEWARIRAEAEAARETLRTTAALAEISAAQRLAEALLAEQRRIADAQRGGTMELLRGLARNAVRLPNLVADAGAFAEHFQRRAQGPRVDGTAVRPGDEIVEGSQIEFPAGVYVLDTRRLFERSKDFPRDLLIAGVGMDRTLLRIQEISTRDEVASLTFRDLTLDCNNDYMTDLRRDSPATIRLDRCRVIGFDMGAGGSVMFAARSGALYASECRFEAGYSRAPAGFGNLFRVRSGLLVRMEHCLFDGPFRSIYDPNRAATYHFVGCEIRDTKAHLGRCRSSAADGVTFEDCRLVELAGEANDIRRSLADINPDWPARKD